MRPPGSPQTLLVWRLHPHPHAFAPVGAIGPEPIATELDAPLRHELPDRRLPSGAFDVDGAVHFVRVHRLMRDTETHVGRDRDRLVAYNDIELGMDMRPVARPQPRTRDALGDAVGRVRERGCGLAIPRPHDQQARRDDDRSEQGAATMRVRRRRASRRRCSSLARRSWRARSFCSLRLDTLRTLPSGADSVVGWTAGVCDAALVIEDADVDVDESGVA